MDPEQQKIMRERQMELTRREMQRKSLDTIRVFNPLDHKFKFMYDSYWFYVDAKKYKDFPRYLAIHYFKKISEFMIGQQALKEGDELLKMREQQFGKSFIDKYVENKEVWDKVPKLNDPDLLKVIRDQVIKGVVTEYAMDLPEENPALATKPPDMRSLHEQLFEGINKKVVEIDLTPQTPVNNLASEVTNDSQK